MDDVGNKVVKAKSDSLEKYIQRMGYNEFFDFQITGTAHLLDKNMRYLSTSLIQGLSVSVLIVALIIGFIYRSFSILAISIITNMIPLIFVAGLMGYFGINLKTSTAIVIRYGDMDKYSTGIEIPAACKLSCKTVTPPKR